MIEPGDEGRRPAAGDGFADAVTFAFGDAESARFGLARIGLGAGSPATASALALLFVDAEVKTAVAQGELEVGDPSWDAVEADGVRMEVVEPLREWRVAVDGAFDLGFVAAGPPIELPELGGMRGYEQLCRVEGTAGGGPIACLGQRGHAWGVADWPHLDLARTVAAWWDDSHALALTAVRPAGASGHHQEAIAAFLLDDGEEGAAGPVVRPVAEPRLSTTYDAEGRQRRAGVELWVAEEDEMPRRAGGQVACGTSLELGRLRLDCAFFDWRMEGRVGVGRYDVLRRT
jgi:hypothetical protein